MPTSVNTDMYVRTYVCVMYVGLYVCTRIYVSMYDRKYVWMNICMCEYMYAYMNVRMYVCGCRYVYE
jgi:hypothetical protein